MRTSKRRALTVAAITSIVCALFGATASVASGSESYSGGVTSKP